MFTARYGLSPYIKQTRLVFKGLNIGINQLLQDEKKMKLKESKCQEMNA